MRINLDRLVDSTADTRDGTAMIAVGVAICERLEAGNDAIDRLTAAVERVADYVGEYGIPDGTGRNLRYYAEDRKACATNPRAEGDDNG